jgi:hypothetical protein
MDLTPWNPWQELERVQGQVDDLLACHLSLARELKNMYIVDDQGAATGTDGATLR